MIFLISSCVCTATGLLLALAKIARLQADVRSACRDLNVLQRYVVRLSGCIEHFTNKVDEHDTTLRLRLGDLDSGPYRQ